MFTASPKLLYITAFFIASLLLCIPYTYAQKQTPTQAYTVKEHVSFTLPYRAQNRWVHLEDNQSLNALTNYAKNQHIYTFKVVLPESSETNLYIERLLVVSRIIKARLKNENIVFKQELGNTHANTIQITPIALP